MARTDGSASAHARSFPRTASSSGNASTGQRIEPVVSRAMRFEHVLVVGAGQMGGGIAQVVAASGRHVSLHDAQPGATDRALAAMGKSLAKLAEKGGPQPDEGSARVSLVGDLVPAELMIEAVVEEAAAQEGMFRCAAARQ